ncbi:MAG: FAD-dependent monooxygenase [Thermodesulfobacteriota bacterium]
MKINKNSGMKKSNIRYGPEMKVLIVGGGIAGLTLAGLLQQRGFTPKVVEQASEYGKVGYVIVIWPSGSRVLKGLGLYEQLKKAGCHFTKYNVYDYKGNIINSYTIEKVIKKYGPIISIYRPELINILRKAIDPNLIKMNTTISSIKETDDCVEVEYDDGLAEKFDIVIGCDGIKSKTRSHIFGEQPLTYSGMSGWGFWVDPQFSESDGIVEYWGKGKFFGMWPTKGKLAVFSSVRVEKNTYKNNHSKIDDIKNAFKGFGGVVPKILNQLNDPDEIYQDNYNDLRINSWSKGRVVLVGDAAHAVLPNAGAGVSMAMESAAVLAEELCRTDSKYFTHSFTQYETRRRSRVGKVQDQSRIMGKLIYANSHILSSLRDRLMKLYSSGLLYKYWDKILKDPL